MGQLKSETMAHPPNAREGQLRSELPTPERAAYFRLHNRALKSRLGVGGATGIDAGIASRKFGWQTGDSAASPRIRCLDRASGPSPCSEKGQDGLPLGE